MAVTQEQPPSSPNPQSPTTSPAPAPPTVEITAEDKAARGQFFTRHVVVQEVMCSLVTHNRGRTLEPCAGSGHLVAALEANHPDLHLEAVELDPRLEPVCATPIIHHDFFAFAAGRDATYDVIFTNPPYVAWREVEAATRATARSVKAAYSDKTNLYHLFIDRLIDLLVPGGEMVLIVPKEWLYTTSAAPLRNKLRSQGSLTHLIDCGEEKLFEDASVPALLIFRFVKGLRSEHLLHADSLNAARAGNYESRVLATSGSRWLLLDDPMAAAIDSWGRLGDQYAVRVGLVTGMDRVFRLEDSQPDIEAACVQDQLTTDRRLVRYLNLEHVTSFEGMPPRAARYLGSHKDALLGRRIAQFDETNWWRYGAVRNEPAMRSATERFFALAKTRSTEPFFTEPTARFFNGGVLGLFHRSPSSLPSELAVSVLNHPRYRRILEAMFLTSNDKVSLQPATLEDAPFPPSRRAARQFLRHADNSPSD